MKVIDLLNKIANGEEVPKKIKYNNKNWNYKDGIMEYISDDTCFSLSNFEFDELNEEVEIIEPLEHKIPEKLSFILHDDDIVEIPSNEMLMNKINEILKYLEVNK